MNPLGPPACVGVEYLKVCKAAPDITALAIHYLQTGLWKLRTDLHTLVSNPRNCRLAV